MQPRHVLLLGLEPAAVDFTAFPGLDEPTLVAGLEGALAAVVAAGFSAEWCLFDTTWETARTRITASMAARSPDAVMIGAGVRNAPGLLLLFEQIVNLIHEAAPRARLCFNTSPSTTPEAVLRWIRP